MKKKNVKKQYPSIRKHSTFKALWAYYRKVQKDYVKALKRHKDTKTAYAELKSKKAEKTLLKTWKDELKNAKKSKQFLDAIVKDARRHIKRWLKAYYALNDLADGRSKLSPAKAKNKKSSSKKVSKPPKKAPAKAKKVGKVKAEKTKVTKPKATPIKVTAPVTRKVAVAKTLVKAPAKTATKKAAPKTTASRPTRKAPVKKAAPKTTATKTATTRRRTVANRPDNLKRVEGIGVKIEQLLRNAGIDSFEKLSKSTQATLRNLLDGAGPHYRISDPTTWPKQAGLAAQGKWEELKTWQDELKGGRIVK